MIRANFSTARGGSAFGRDMLRILDEALELTNTSHVHVALMGFSFTNPEIARRLVSIASKKTANGVDLLLDWSQSAPLPAYQAHRLLDAELPNIQLRFKADQPFVWDRHKQRLRWSYRASRGLLHHKVVLVFRDGRFWKSGGGSANWTINATRGYENFLEVTPDCADGRQLAARLSAEFRAMWCDGCATFCPSCAEEHRQAVQSEYRNAPGTPPDRIQGLATCPCPAEPGLPRPNPAWLQTESSLRVAFSFRAMRDRTSSPGHAVENSRQHFAIVRPRGRKQRVPLSIDNLARDTVLRAVPGDRLWLAFYGLSRRVSLYGVLLDAARRGVYLRFILYRRTMGELARHLSVLSAREGLPIRTRTTSRLMHQKYVIHPESHTVFTGTANMTYDALSRHAEHMIQQRNDPALCKQFMEDFTRMWCRLQ